MHRRGITLIELTVAITLAAMLLLVMTVQYVANLKFQNLISDKIAATQEAEAAMCQMTQMLRFVSASSVTTDTDGTYAHSIKATLKGGYLQGLGADTAIEYGLRKGGDNKLYYQLGINAASSIASNITSWAWNTVSNYFTITLTAKKNNETVTLATTIYGLP